MSYKFKLPPHDVYNKNRSLNIVNDKENIPHISNKAMAGRNPIPTPSEDDEFDDDDDDILIAASQQFDRKLAQEKAEAAAKVGSTTILQLQGENAILRDQLTKSSREKEQIHLKKLEDDKLQEQKFRKEIENLKSKLEFRDRDVEELRNKLQSSERSADNAQPAKRPRLSVVKFETKKGPRTGTASSKSRQCFRITACKGYGSDVLPSISSINLNEVFHDNNDIERTNLISFLHRLHCNEDLQKLFNISSCTGKSVSSKEISSTISHLFEKTDTLPTWQEKSTCLQILSILLAHNNSTELDAQVPKMLKVLPGSTPEQHILLTETLLKCGANVLSCCSHSTSNACLLSGLFRYQSSVILDLLLSSVIQQQEPIDPCFCCNEMLKYICIMLKSTLSGDLLTPSIEIENESTFHKCLKLLRSLSPFFLDMKLNCYVQTMFFGCLDLLKKCSSMSLSGASMTDQLYEATFETANNSMSA